MMCSLDSYRKWINQYENGDAHLIPNIINIDTHPYLLPCIDELPLSESVHSSLRSYLCSGKFILLKLIIERILQIGEYKSDIPSTSIIPKIVIFSQKPSTLSLIEDQLLTYNGLQYRVLKSTDLLFFISR